MLEISVNNTIKTLPHITTLDHAMTAWGYNLDDMLGVAINQTFVPKTKWSDTTLQHQDKVDILQPIVGG